ncbi:MAG: hypothetical protein QNK37_30870 [Acidobacteriota bacterium]|nr:hypothetical protein [Acidobacteriota bacterium]
MSEELSRMLDATKEKLQESLRVLNQDMAREFQELKEWKPPVPEPIVVRPTPADLVAASQNFSAGTSQIEILKALVDHVARIVPRVLLLIRKGGNLHGWTGEGFGPDFINGGMKKIVWPLDRYPELIKVAQDKQPMMLNFSDLSDINTEIESFDGFTPFKSCFYPLVVKGKVAAVLYLDSGSEAGLEGQEGAQLLCHLAGLELTALAFMGKKAREAAPAPKPAPAPEPPRAKPRILPPVEPEPVPDFHPGNVIKSKPAAPLESEAMESGATLDDFRPQTIPEPMPMPAAMPPAAPEVEEDPGIKKARRVARVLVSDLKLYNEEAVTAAQSAGDLYSRLKEDIDRSFAHYKERTSGLVPDGTNFFKLELIRQLGDGIGPLPF